MLLLLLPFSGRGQLVITPERSALHQIQKKKWDRAKSQLRKSLRKDSVNVTARYIMSVYFFQPDNPDFQIDSAYRYNLGALRGFASAGVKERERMKRFPLDSTILILLREQIDSAAFEQAKKENTETAYLKFLSTYHVAAQRQQAEELRDEVAYLDALKANSYEAFHQYLVRYPASVRADEAKRKYDRLLYEAKTKDKRLKSYEEFLVENPATPYRKVVEQQIFEITTASGEPDAFRSFLKKYSTSAYAKKAQNILYHLLDDDDSLDETFWTDSVKSVHHLRDGYLVPFIRDGKFGFMDSEGKERIKPSGEELDDGYRCGNIREDILVLDNRIMARNGATIFTGSIDAIEDIGAGFIAVQSGDCMYAIHKTGFQVGDCADDVHILSDRILAIRKDNLWMVYTLTGRLLTSSEWDALTAIRNVMVFRKGNTNRLITLQNLALVADQQKLKLSDELDDVKSWPNNLIWVKTGGYQGVLDQNLEPVIRLDKHVLQPLSKGARGESSSGYVFFNSSGRESVPFRQVHANESWTAVKKENWRLFNTEALTYTSPTYDSIIYSGPFAIATHGDSIRVYCSPQFYLDFSKSARVVFIPGKDSTAFLMTEEGDKKTVFTAYAQKLFTVVYDKIDYVGSGIFLVSKKEKKGLITSDGKQLLPLEYDAIGSGNNQVITILKSMKFGLFDPVTRRLIKPHYDKNLMRYNARYLTAYKDGLYAFIGWDDKPVSLFDFEEIRFWNDTTALVKKNFQWKLYHIAGKKILLDNIKSYKLVSDTPLEKIAIIAVENAYGVFSSVRGEIIPPTFSDIVNLGSAEDPLYFTEKHVEEASIFVVIYYDKNGKLLRRQVCEVEDYERIYCAQH
ncbi:MAG: hypothetical protein JNM57_08965 [Cyclobacteriaceae bacterium]|nr:hypothetical protein [Cyclobacteriaceae bacterium]